MTALLVVLAAVVGLAVGSFLNVVVHRVPLGASVVHPPSACPRCGSAVRPRDNVPVLSWLLLRGRCRDCAAPISARYPLVEAGTAVAFALTAGLVGPRPVLPALLYLVAIGIALVLIDVDVHRLPDAIVLPSYPVVAVLLAGASLAGGGWGALARAGAGAAVLLVLYGVLFVAKPGGMGLGDVKLSGLLGAYLGYASWSALVVGAASAFVLGGAVGVVLLAAGRVGRRGRLPFGPFMLVGAVLGLLVGPQVAGWYLGVSGLAAS